MTYEYAQKVMKAAGVEKVQTNLCARCQDLRKMHECGGACAVVGCSCQGYVASYHYPDPLTSGDAFHALWDALVTKDFLVRATAWNTSAGKKSTFICIEGKNKRADSDNEDIKVALVEAAGQALGVSRG